MAAEVKAVLLMFGGFGLLLSAACGGGDDTATLKAQVAALQTTAAQAATGDIVVGVVHKCLSTGSETKPSIQVSGEGCTKFGSLVGKYLLVTVRTGSGGSYTVELPDTTNVTLGDRWPPK